MYPLRGRGGGGEGEEWGKWSSSSRCQGNAWAKGAHIIFKGLLGPGGSGGEARGGGIVLVEPGLHVAAVGGGQGPAPALAAHLAPHLAPELVWDGRL